MRRVGRVFVSLAVVACVLLVGPGRMAASYAAEYPGATSTDEALKSLLSIASSQQALLVSVSKSVSAVDKDLSAEISRSAGRYSDLAGRIGGLSSVVSRMSTDAGNRYEASRVREVKMLDDFAGEAARASGRYSDLAKRQQSIKATVDGEASKGDGRYVDYVRRFDSLVSGTSGVMTQLSGFRADQTAKQAAMMQVQGETKTLASELQGLLGAAKEAVLAAVGKIADSGHVSDLAPIVKAYSDDCYSTGENPWWAAVQRDDCAMSRGDAKQLADRIREIASQAKRVQDQVAENERKRSGETGAQHDESKRDLGDIKERIREVTEATKRVAEKVGEAVEGATKRIVEAVKGAAAGAGGGSSGTGTGEGSGTGSGPGKVGLGDGGAGAAGPFGAWRQPLQCIANASVPVAATCGGGPVISIGRWFEWRPFSFCGGTFDYSKVKLVLGIALGIAALLACIRTLLAAFGYQPMQG